MTTEISIPILHTIGALPDTVYALFVLIIIDYITGVCLAVKEKKISSKIGAKGIAFLLSLDMDHRSGFHIRYHDADRAFSGR